MDNLHWICAHPTHYHNFFFNSLVKDRELNFKVHFLNSLLSSHPWKEDFISGYEWSVCSYHLGIDWNLIKLASIEDKSFFVVGGWNNLSTIVLLNTLIKYKRNFAIWTDTPNYGKGRGYIRGLARDRWLKRIFKHASYVLGTGQLAVLLLNRMGCPEEKLINFPFWVDLELFSPVKYFQKANKKQIICFLSSGRIVNAEKGFDIALRALAKLKDDRILDEFRYKIAGIGPDDWKLRSLSEELGIQNNIELVGWLETRNLPEFYRSGSIFIHPSYFDPFPNAVLEAMACGLAVIGSNKAGSVLDRIEHMKNGLVFRTGDVNDLSEKIKFLLDNPEKMENLGIEARRRAEEWHVDLGINTIKNILRNIKH
jgi:glycosyltransferase involved in cell wall biosynthesis